MRRPFLLLAALLTLLASPCAHAARHAPPVLILVSIDGFRADYLDRGITPNLSALAAAGARAAMRPSFPSKTFPNHYAIVTGLRPDRNGLVGNKANDPGHPDIPFTTASKEPFWWDEAEPIWVAAEKAGIRSATMFWPGTDVEIRATRPEDWQHYDKEVTSAQRVDAVIDWLRRPPATRPRLVTLYFDTVDTAGHDSGPDGAATREAIAAVDVQIGRLRAGLAALRQPADLVIVADHGMAATSSDRIIRLDAIADPADYRTVEDGTYAAIEPQPGHDAVLAARLLAPHPHLQCWRKDAIPARFHYGANPRVAPFICLADPGWLVQSKPPEKPFAGGNHGYDNADPTMAALFVAAGPAFRRGVRLPDFDNVDIYPLLRRLLGLPPVAGLDGALAPLAAALR